jgi:hypothetical protein
MLDQIAALIWLFGLIGFGGPLIAFSFLLPLADRIGKGDPWHVDRVYRAWGPGSGICLGAIWLGGMTRHYLQTGELSWDLGSATGQLTTVAHLVFLLLWVNYTYLEIWVLSPIRKLDCGAKPDDAALYRASRGPMIRSTALSAFLFVVCVTLLGLTG